MDANELDGASVFSAWTLLHQSYLLTYKYLDQIVSRLGISQAQASVLLVLKGAQEPLPLSKLARYLVQEAQSVTSLVDRLESRDLVRRVPDHRDRRVIHVELTPVGDTMFDQIFPATWKAYREIFLGLNQQELEQLASLAARVRDRSSHLLGLDPGPYESASQLLRFTPATFDEVVAPAGR